MYTGIQQHINTTYDFHYSVKIWADVDLPDRTSAAAQTETSLRDGPPSTDLSKCVENWKHFNTPDTKPPAQKKKRKTQYHIISCSLF